MSTILGEGYVIRFKKKKEAPIPHSRDNLTDALFSFVVGKKLKNDYLYFNPTVQKLRCLAHIQILSILKKLL